MARKTLYTEWRDLILESWNWTPNHHSLDQLRSLFSQFLSPSPSRLSELRLIERRLGFDESEWSLNGSRLKPHDRRHLEVYATKSQTSPRLPSD